MPLFPNVVLVRPIYSSNIGAASRAMANMGGGSLILIEPQCEIDLKAHRSAAGGQEALLNRRVYSNLAEFYGSEGEGQRVAFCRRSGKNRKVFSFRNFLTEQLSECQSAADSAFDDSSKLKARNWYLFFGPENNGLSKEDLDLIPWLCELPTFGTMPSMNLSQSILLALYLFQQDFGSLQRQEESNNTSESASDSATSDIQPLSYPEAKIRDLLTSLDFDLKPRRRSAYDTLKSIFMIGARTPGDWKLLVSILDQIKRKMNDPKSSN